MPNTFVMTNLQERKKNQNQSDSLKVKASAASLIVVKKI